MLSWVSLILRGQTDRGYKKPEPEPDFSNLLFVSFNWNRIFQIDIRLGIKLLRIIRYSYPFQKKSELKIQPDNSFQTDITKIKWIFLFKTDNLVLNGYFLNSRSVILHWMIHFYQSSSNVPDSNMSV